MLKRLSKYLSQGSLRRTANRLFDKVNTLKFGDKFAILAFVGLLVWYLFSLPRPLFDVPYSTLVVDRNGEMLGARISSDGQWRFPMSDTLPDKYIACVTRFEDRYFRFHPGVNPLAIGRAMVQNIRASRVVSGGSTLTMQTVRLMRQNRRTYFEKIIEVILATRLELSYSKREILALYAAHAPMGGNVVGIDAAAWRYFGHAASSLSWAEAATLAVLPNSPALMHFGKNREQLIGKRNKLLKRLLTDKAIDPTDYRLAIAEPLPANPHALPQIAPHLVTRVYLAHPGRYVQSTIKKGLQLQAEETLDRWNAEFAQNSINNLAALIVDIRANEVLAYCGNTRFREAGAANQVDIIRAPRSTGSILKPFLYCAMLHEGLLLPKELMPDIPININGFAPKNFSLQYDGAVPADEALARSLNIPSVIALRRYSVPKFHQYLKKLGFTSLTRPAEHYGLSLILGGAEATLWDVANGFAHLGRTVNDFNESGGKYFDKQDFGIIFPVESPHRQTTSEPLFDAGAAWLTLEALTNVNRPEEVDWQFIPSMRKVAWKTGTSYGFRDAWAIGVTPRYLVAVWTGNADGEGRPGLTGARTSANVMFDLFNLLPMDGWFAPPYKALREAEVCRQGGCLRGVNCPESAIDTVLVPLGGKRQGHVCRFHKTVHLSSDGKWQVFEQCAGDKGLRTASWFVLPPAWEWYYKQYHPDYVVLPPFAPECLDGGAGQIMQFIYPYPRSVIKLPRQLDGSRGEAIFELAHRKPATTVYWHLDSDYLGETADIHRMPVAAEKGEYTVTAVDEDGNTASIRFRIE